MKHLQKPISVVLLVALIFGVGFFAGQQSRTQPAAAQQDEELEELFAPFWESWDALNQRYVDPLDPEQLMTGAIRGMVEAVGDPNMEYMDAEALAAWNESLNGEFEGIGATVRQDEETGELIIVAPIKGSPAEASGIIAGDRIVEVGGEDVTDLDQTEIINLVRGPAGTPVILGIRREGEEELLQITVIRDVIVLPAADYQLLDNNVGYIQVYNFSFETSTALREALTELDANNLSGLVLDFRGNPGGYLDTALDVISLFVEEGTILIEELPGDQEQTFAATGNAMAPDVPIVVLVDQGSASASELVAGALRDRGRAVIVGVPTFGKNTVQTISPISNGGALRISIARWLTPNGESVQEGGLQPDVLVELDPESDPDFDNQLQAAIRALKGFTREQAYTPLFGRF